MVRWQRESDLPLWTPLKSADGNQIAIEVSQVHSGNMTISIKGTI